MGVRVVRIAGKNTVIEPFGFLQIAGVVVGYGLLQAGVDREFLGWKSGHRRWEPVRAFLTNRIYKQAACQNPFAQMRKHSSKSSRASIARYLAPATPSVRTQA